MSEVYDVVIVGGGCAGTKAAETLYTNGVENILVLEAQDRLGGRIHTFLLDNDEKIPIENGANWLHGTVGNPLYELVQANQDVFFNKKDRPFVERTVKCLDQDGNVYDTGLNEQIDTFYWDLIEDIRAKRIGSNELNGKSFEDFIFETLARITGGDTNELVKIKRAIVRKNMSLHCINAGCESLDDCALTEYGNYVEFDGGDNEFPGGYSKLIEFLANRLPDQAIRLNHAVEHITKPNQNLIVRCQNGSQFETRHLIVTCSLGYLKKHHEALFETGLLNESKIEAIQKLKIGFVNKLLFEYEDLSSFFPAETDSLHLLSTNNDASNGWVYRIAKIGRFFENIIRMLLTGDDALSIEGVSDEEICLQMTTFLRRILKNDKVPLPKRLLRTNWCGDQYSLGSYTYIPNGATIEHIHKLAEPIYFNNSARILFAGEAQHPKYYSTVLAAYLTGEHEALRVCKQIAENKN